MVDQFVEDVEVETGDDFGDCGIADAKVTDVGANLSIPGFADQTAAFERVKGQVGINVTVDDLVF